MGRLSEVAWAPVLASFHQSLSRYSLSRFSLSLEATIERECLGRDWWVKGRSHDVSPSFALPPAVSRTAAVFYKAPASITLSRAAPAMALELTEQCQPLGSGSTTFSLSLQLLELQYLLVAELWAASPPCLGLNAYNQLPVMTSHFQTPTVISAFLTGHWLRSPLSIGTKMFL